MDSNPSPSRRLDVHDNNPPILPPLGCSQASWRPWFTSKTRLAGETVGNFPKQSICPANFGIPRGCERLAIPLRNHEIQTSRVVIAWKAAVAAWCCNLWPAYLRLVDFLSNQTVMHLWKLRKKGGRSPMLVTWDVYSIHDWEFFFFLCNTSFFNVIQSYLYILRHNTSVFRRDDEITSNFKVYVYDSQFFQVSTWSY